VVERPKAWMCQVVRRQLQESRHMQARWSSGEASLMEAVPSRLLSPEEATQLKIDRERMQCFLRPIEIECLSMRREGFRYHEIGRVLGIPAGSVGPLLNRAVHKVKRAKRIRPRIGRAVCAE
jgi:DNA-directed RNA polymerase specialized sigma24 family protein